MRLRGTSGALAQLRGTDLVAVIDLRSARPGRRLFHLLPGDVVVPTGVKVVQVSPPTLSMTFEATASRKVPVVPDIDDEPAPGFEVTRVTSDPATVDVVGPASEVRGVTEATTEPVSVRGATRPVIDTVSIGVPDSNVRLRIPGTRSSRSRFGRCRSSAPFRQCPSNCATLAPASAPRRIRPL